MNKREKFNKYQHSFGPIDNLEDYLQYDWWKKIFNSYYLKTDGDVVNDSKVTKEEIDLFIRKFDLKLDEKILDLCCGQGRHSLELARRGYKNICGLDKSSYLIRRAKYVAISENLKLQFREGDARKTHYPTDTFDKIMILGNSFGYFESIQDDIQVLKEALRILKPWGKIFLDLTDGEYIKRNFQPRSWEWIDKKYFVCRERNLSSDQERLISREVITEVNKGVVVDQFYAERLYNREKLKTILERSGFSDIAFLGNLSPNSIRNQDLGMMEKRIIVSGVVRKEWTPKKNKRNVKNITVILGDPRRIDIIKPDALFDDDDIYTINQLKSALNELKDYQFTYLDNHENLIKDLNRNKTKIDFVFNLCDEGYYNDARKELHLPALLEILGIPYSGSGPQCLAFCYDKSLVRGIAKEMNIPVADGIYISQEDLSYDFLPFNFPVIVKPNFGDSSFGITQRNYVTSKEDLINVIKEIRERFGYENPILIEEFLEGADLSVGIIGNPPENYKVLPISEEDYSVLPEELPKICGYEAKWLSDSPYWSLKSIPARITEEKKEFIIDCCIKLFKRLECRDYCRFDWRVDKEGIPKLLEVNPNPGWCWDGHLAKMSKFADESYKDMLKDILLAAENRIKNEIIKPCEELEIQISQ
ncbi:MAG: methyltransferase domain-containing protein [Promethearchaeota archaeon]|nr:MAG: methyltransferase domain-containing protein [Candidatus Lokiarchaeota archaeon]